MRNIVGRPTVEPKYRGIQKKNLRGGGDNDISPEKRQYIQLKAQAGDTKIPGGTREGNASENVGNPFRDPFLSRGTEQAVPRRAPFDAPRSPSLALVPVLSAITPCAAMWGGRGAVSAVAGGPVALGSSRCQKSILKQA